MNLFLAEVNKLFSILRTLRSLSLVETFVKAEVKYSRVYHIYIAAFQHMKLIREVMKVLIVLALCGFLVPFVNAQDNVCANIQDADRIDCLPAQDDPQEKDCVAKKCCWTPSKDNLQVPSCYYPPVYQSYTRTLTEKHDNGLEATSTLTTPSGFKGDAKTLRVTVQYLTKDILRIRITDNDTKRFEPPVPVIPRFPPIGKNASLNYEVSMGDKPLSIKVTRKLTNETIFDTSVGALVLSDQFLEISTRLSTKYLSGIGEHSTGTGTMRGGKKQRYVLYNRGELVRAGYPNLNLYGSHPFFLNIEKTKQSHGVFLLNSNAMEITAYESEQITFRPIGGIFDFFIFLGPDSDSVISQYTSVIGRPFLPPYWSLGFHLCRYQYNSTEETRKAWKRNVDAGLYFETQWNDIDYMEDRKCFTYDRVRYAGLPELVKDIHDEGMHYMMIHDPGLDGNSTPGDYAPSDEARDLDILIKDYKGEILEFRVWQPVTIYPDFSNPKTEGYWIRQFERFHYEIDYDGAWIDMNEPFGFANGSLTGCPDENTLDHPPFVPGKDMLYNGSICLSAKQFIGDHYYAHNLYGLQEGIATNKAMTQILKRRPFILSRSTFPGYGKYGAHWLGDVLSRWEYLEDSVERMITFNMYGIPMVGSDICGFAGNTTFELCQRWTELGAFYPFSRNHNDFDTIEQDPAFMGPEMVALHKKVYHIRYYLLPHLYTLLYHSHIDGVPTIRSLVFEYPNDPQTYKIKNSFLWGKSLLVIPVLEQGKVNVTSYIPKGVWYDYYTLEQIVSQGSDMTFDAPVDHIPLLLKGGNVIPAQVPATRIVESRKNPFHLLIALDENGQAQGDLYWDDGDSIDPIGDNQYNLISFEVANNTLNIKVLKDSEPSPMILDHIIVMGIDGPVSYAQIDNKMLRLHSNYDTRKRTLKLDVGATNLKENTVITWYPDAIQP